VSQVGEEDPLWKEQFRPLVTTLSGDDASQKREQLEAQLCIGEQCGGQL